MCAYCGRSLEEKALEITLEDQSVVKFCDEECAIYYFQEQQQTNFQCWVNIRTEQLLYS